VFFVFLCGELLLLLLCAAKKVNGEYFTSHSND